MHQIGSIPYNSLHKYIFLKQKYKLNISALFYVYFFTTGALIVTLVIFTGFTGTF